MDGCVIQQITYTYLFATNITCITQQLHHCMFQGPLLKLTSRKDGDFKYSISWGTNCWLFFSLCLYHFPSSPSLPSQSAWYFFFHSVEFPQLFRLLKFYLEIVTGKTMLFHVLAMAEVLCANCLSYSFQEKAQTGSANTNTRNIKSISPKWVFFLCVCAGTL